MTTHRAEQPTEMNPAEVDSGSGDSGSVESKTADSEAVNDTVDPVPPETSSSPKRSKSLALPIDKKSLWPAAVLMMVVVAGFVGWRATTVLRNPPEAEEEIAEAARLPVRAVEARTAPIQGWVFSDGNVQALRGRHLTFEANGEITYLAQINGRYLREGDFVSQGQLLATVDARQYQADIRATAADAQVAERQRGQADVSLNQAAANLEKAKSDLNLAQTELKRYQELYAQGAVAESDRDAYLNRVDQAEAALKIAQEDVQSAKEGVASASASVVAAEARLENANISQEDTQLISPIDGVVAYLNIREGDYWTPQRIQASGDYQSIVESVPIIVVDPQDLEVAVEVPAFDGSQLRPGQTAYIVLDSEFSRASIGGVTDQDLIGLSKGLRGQVFAVNPSVTPGGRAVEVRINVTQGIDRLRVGERVSVWIESESEPRALVLPFGAIVFRDRVPYVFVMNRQDGTVEQRQVKVGIEGLSTVQILDGVQPGEFVVTEGRDRLVDGSLVEMIGDVETWPFTE